MEWSLSEVAHEWIRAHLPAGSTILELGSGAGSAALAEHFTIYSVEHDKEWVNKYPNVNYIYAPIVHHKPIEGFEKHSWYDKDVIAQTKNLIYSLIICDGPPACIGRAGFLKYISLFKNDVPILFDDVHRALEMKLAKKVAARLNSDLLVLGLNTSKHIAICWPGRVWK